MDRKELRKAINATLEEITEIGHLLDHIPNPTEKRKLLRRLKELQYLQLWHLDQLERQSPGEE